MAPSEFVAARAALVRELKAEGRKDEAAAVQQLRRPRLAEHALNMVARAHGGVVADWAQAASAVDAAQSLAIGGGGALQLREATIALRSAHAAVLEAAVRELGDSGAAQRDEVAEALRSLAHPQGVPLLQAGVVGSQQLGDLVLFAGAPEPVVNRRPAGERPRQATPAPATQQQPPPASPPRPTVDAKQLRAHERAAAAAQAESQRADQALHAARAALAAAKDAVAAATERSAHARGAARAAAQALDQLRAGEPTA